VWQPSVDSNGRSAHFLQMKLAKRLLLFAASYHIRLSKLNLKKSAPNGHYYLEDLSQKNRHQSRLCIGISYCLALSSEDDDQLIRFSVKPWNKSTLQIPRFFVIEIDSVRYPPANTAITV
jgi:hypothetical protein